MEDELAIAKREIARLRRIIGQIEQVIADTDKPTRKQISSRGSDRRTATRVRRSGRDLMQFRKVLKAERKRGVPVTAIARKHGVSTAYIYQFA